MMSLSKSKNIPITLEVADIEVSKENNSKSIFLNEWYFDKGELDSTQEMFNAYTEKLLEYRLSPDYIVVDTKHTTEDIQYFVDLAYEYMQNPNCTNLTMPIQFVTEGNLRVFDTALFKNYLRAILRKSFETNYNMMAKMIAYINDEPHITGRVDDAIRCTVLFKECLDAVAGESWLLTQSSPIKNETVASMLKMENVMTTEYSTTFAEIPYNDTTISPTFCPTVDKYDTASEREAYANQIEKWWYTCVSPKVPYPTYHTEDTLLSARTMGWMQAEYGVVGNLFWATNIYAKYDGSKYTSIEDSYENAVRFPNVNGDGYLFYPGAPYGIFGPIGSLRLEAIRDGLEEYELIVAMLNDYKDIKAATGLTFDEKKVVESLTASLYDGTKVHAQTKAFYESRKALINLAQLANSKANLCITDYYDDNNGTVTYKVYVNDGYELKNNGVVVTESQNVTGGKLYTVKNSLSSATNQMRLSLEIDGKEYSFTQQLGGAVVTTNPADENLSGYKSFQGSTNTFSLVDAGTVISGSEGKLIQMVIGAANKNSYQAVAISGKMTEGINRQNNKIILYIYYAGTDNPKLDVMGKFKGSSQPVGLKSIELKEGINEIEMVISGLNWDRYDALEELRMFIGTLAGEPERTLYIVKCVSYGK